MARRRTGRVVGVVVGVLLLGAGGYVAADAYDLAPGVLTLEPPPPTPVPFPTAPGAIDAAPIGTVLSHLDPEAPTPDADVLTDLAQGLVGDARTGDSVGVVVADVLTGETLVDIDGASSRTPASTAKVLTAVAAVGALGTERTLATTVVQDAPGRIVLVGGGDMMLAAGAGDADAVNGRAGLADLADATVRSLNLAGTTDVTLTVDDSLFSGPAYSPGWQPGHHLYAAPVAALAVDVARTRDEPYPPRHADPAMHAARTFADLLDERGITVAGPTRGEASPGALELARVESAGMRELVRYVLQTSDNTVAEVLGRLVAIQRGLPGSFHGATTAVLAELRAQGVDTAGVTLADCSGLADGSVLPARVLVDLLLVVAAPGRADLLPVAVDLPVSGWQGTLADRFGDGNARGVVRAKTGSLPGVTSLAGTVQTADGRLLVFAVLADDTGAGGQVGPRAAIDEFVQAVAACGCSQ